LPRLLALREYRIGDFQTQEEQAERLHLDYGCVHLRNTACKRAEGSLSHTLVSKEILYIANNGNLQVKFRNHYTSKGKGKYDIWTKQPINLQARSELNNMVFNNV
jgi:hypothetical protein